MNFEYDESVAREIVGAVMLVGITYLDSEGEFQSQRQIFGTVLSADPKEGIKLKLSGQHEGHEYNLPPDTSCIWKAEPGVYTLSESKETLENPDYLCTWEVHHKKEK